MDRGRYNDLATCFELLWGLKPRIENLAWPHRSLLKSHCDYLIESIFDATRFDHDPPLGETSSLMELVEELENANK